MLTYSDRGGLYIVYVDPPAGLSDALTQPKPETARLHHLCRPGRIPTAAGPTARVANHPCRPTHAPGWSQAEPERQTETHGEGSHAAGVHRADRRAAPLRTDCDIAGIPWVRAQAQNGLSADAGAYQ